MLPSFSLLDERLAFAVKGFLLRHKLATLLGPCLDLFCTSLVLKLQVIAIFFSRCILAFFFTTARCYVGRNLTPQNSMNDTTMLRNAYSLDPWLV
jgi:hypothetical protein